MSFPASVTTEWVRGQFLVGFTDGPDPDQDPEAIPAQGTVVFVPSVPYLPVPTASPNPLTVLPEPRVAVLDSEGYVSTPTQGTLEPAYRGMRLETNNDPDVSVQDWTWTATYKFTNSTKSVPTHSFVLNAGVPVDLTTVVKVPSSTGIGTEQAEALAASAQAAAVASAADAALAAAAAEAAAGAAQVTDSNIATLIGNPETDTAAEVEVLVAAAAAGKLDADDAVITYQTLEGLDANAAAKANTDGTALNGVVKSVATTAAVTAVPPAVAAHIAADPTVVSSAAAMAASNTGLLPKWAANTAYTAGQQVASPAGDIVSAKTAFTSGASYSAANWNPSTQDARISALEEPALLDWMAAYRASDSTPAQILVIGDSITEGTGATTLSNRWQTLLQAYLRRQKGAAGGAMFPFIPGRYATTATGRPTVDVGNVQGGYGWGLGWRTVSLRDDTAKLTYTFTGTSAKIMHLQLTTAGVMKIVVDGGAPILVNTNGATNNAATWSTGPLTPGDHTLTIERDPASAANQYVWIEGVLTFNGDETSGVRVLDAAKHGINAGTQLTTANNGYLAAAVKAAGPFGLAVIGVGTNDYSAGTTTATYRANIDALIASLRAASGGFSGSIVLVNMFKGGGRTDALWDPYGAELAKIAAGDPKITYLDLRWEMPDVPTPTTDPAGQGLYADTLHPSDAGHRKIAGVLARILAG